MSACVLTTLCLPLSLLILGHSAGIEEPGIQDRAGERKGEGGAANRDQIPMELWEQAYNMSLLQYVGKEIKITY